MWDKHGPGRLTLSYTKFPYSPDVFLDEFVTILCMGARFSRRCKMRVFIVDDSSVVVERLADLLTERREVELVGRASNAAAAIRSILQASPDAIILDLQMPGGSGLDGLRAIRRSHLSLWVLVCTNYPYPRIWGNVGPLGRLILSANP